MSLSFHLLTKSLSLIWDYMSLTCKTKAHVSEKTFAFKKMYRESFIWNFISHDSHFTSSEVTLAGRKILHFESLLFGL